MAGCVVKELAIAMAAKELRASLERTNAGDTDVKRNF